MLVSVRTPKGETIDMTLREDVTVGGLKHILVSEFGYVRSVQLMYGTRIVKDEVFVDEFPCGSLIVVGQRIAEQPAQRQFEPDVPRYRSQQYATQADRSPPPPQAGSPYSLRQPQQQPGASRQQPPPSHQQQRSAQPHSQQPHFADRGTPQSHHRAEEEYSRERTSNVHLNHHHQQQHRQQQQPEQYNSPQYQQRQQYATDPRQQQQQQFATDPRQQQYSNSYNSPGQSGTTPTPQRQSDRSSSSSNPHATPPPPLHSDFSDAAPAATITVTVIIPALEDRKIQITAQDDITVASFLKLVANDVPSTAGGKLLFFGKYVTDLGQSIRAVPLKDHSEVMVASGHFLSEKVMVMYLADRSIREVEGLIAETGGVKNAPKAKRNYWNEILMKSLLKLDSLVELDEDMRMRRKGYVRAITALQDALSF